MDQFCTVGDTDSGDYGDCYCHLCGADDTERADWGDVNSNEAKAWNFQQKRIEALMDELEAAEKQIAELEAVKCNFSDSKLLSLAKDIVENLVDTGGSDPEYTKQYIDWTCKRIRITAAGKGE